MAQERQEKNRLGYIVKHEGEKGQNQLFTFDLTEWGRKQDSFFYGNCITQIHSLRPYNMLSFVK